MSNESDPPGAHARADEHPDEWFRLAVTAVDGILYDWNVETGAVTRTPGLLTILGFEPERAEPTASWWLTRIHPDDSPEASADIQRGLASGTGFTVEYRVRDSQDRYVWVSDRGVVVHHIAGRPARVVGSVADLTERKAAERRLAAQYGVSRVLAEASTLADAAPSILLAVCEALSWEFGAVWLVDRDADQLRCEWTWHGGDRAARTFEEATRARTFAPGVGLPGRVWARREPAWIEDVAADENFPRAPFAAEAGLRAAFGFPVTLNREVLGVVEFFSRETHRPDGDLLALMAAVGSQLGQFLERKRAEAERERLAAELEAERTRLTTLVSSVPGVVWEAWGEPDAASQRINFVSDYVETMLGYSVDEWLATPNFWLAVVHPDDRERAASEAAAIFAGCKGGTNEFRWVARDGRSIWVEAQSVVVCDEEGRPLGMRGVTMDVSRRKTMEAELADLLARERHARAEAEEANRSKDDFLATLSHELRTPLTAMLGWARLLRNGSLGEEKRLHAVDAIERAARAQARLIEDVLDVSRIIAGKLRLEMQPVDLAPIVEAAVDATRPAAETKGVSLTSVLDPEAGPVSGDPYRLQQIVWNLVSNAVKFTPEGGRVQVVLERINSHVEITVSDTGEGIESEFLPYVFDRFRQADASTVRRQSGLGLGLAIVKHLVDAHGGVAIASSGGEGRGASFTIRLPLLGVRHGWSEPPTDRRRGEEAPAFAPSLAGVRVLVVDDEPDTREIVAALLEAYGAETTTAASAAEARAAIEQSAPDMLVSDVGMPGEDGYALMRWVRALPPERGGAVPAVALTAYARAEDRIRALSAGFNTHVAKPADPAELAAVVASLVERRGAAGQV